MSSASDDYTDNEKTLSYSNEKEAAKETKCGYIWFYLKKKGIKYITFIVLAHLFALIGGAILMKIQGMISNNFVN